MSSPQQSTCPVCTASIPSSQLVAHVNACLDSTSRILPEESTLDETPLDIPSPPPSASSSSQSSHSPPPSPPPKPPTPLATWLSSLSLSKYTPGLLRAGYRTLTDLLQTPPTDSKLRNDCAVTALGARRKIISALSSLTPSQPAKEAEPPPAKPKRKLWAIFEPGYRAPSTPPKRPRANAPNVGEKAEERREEKPRRHFYCHRVPGTDITVDSFRATKTDPPSSIYFLSHFHSDHYGGMSRKSLPEGSRVFCSAVTASLVHSQLRIPKEFLVEIEVGKKVDVNERGISVWAYDANHCPGAVVFLFFVWKTKRYILHSGDCRFEKPVFEAHDELREVVKRGELDYLFLDTTYCDPRYTFPRQKDVLEEVVGIARGEDKRTRGRCLYFFGTYSIGKEKVFLAVAEALDLKIYAGKRKKGILLQCGFGNRLEKRLVERAGEARVQVVSMRALSPDGLREYAKRNGLNSGFIGRGLAVVIRPTGWSFGRSGKRMRQEDQAVVVDVPYSEHSSFEELKEFVGWANSARVVPTVGGINREGGERLRGVLGCVERDLRKIGGSGVGGTKL